MPEILPARSLPIADGFVFIAQDDADVAALVEAAGDRVGEITVRAGYGFEVPADIATAAGATAVEVEIDDAADPATADATPEPNPPAEPEPTPEPEPEAPAKGAK